ncbi:DUF3182 family protein [Lysobacter sp. F60174L2]|uniref:DUF3182 family protein n=1 Tax=Lysobacter sp. F60174L2 TaxID=3459295 RepID=UPI00403D9B26
MSAALQQQPSAGTVGTVFLVAGETGGGSVDDHGAWTRRDLGRRLATLLGYTFGGDHRPGEPTHGPVYFIPADTLLDGEARALGIRDERDLFGGVVPHAFLTTKTISHPAVDSAARVPEGWSHALGERIGNAVLPGYSAFTPADVQRAGELLLDLGDIRIKNGDGIGGTGQVAVSDHRQLGEVVAALVPADILRHGVVVEQNLADPVTYSIGCLRVGDWTLAYHGTQRVTADHQGREVYGGSELTVVRGGFDALLKLPLPPEQRTAIEHACRYDEAVAEVYPGFFASRRNYDVVAGYDGSGARRCGVLEQSWRIGGASPAELAALMALRADPALQHVRASCHETYSDEPPPAGATVHFRGHDARAGMLCKYSLVE